MAIQTITYSDKTALNSNSGVADANKVNATDMNEIKAVVNNNATELTNANTKIGNVGTTTNITLSTVGSTISASNWYNICSDYTTSSLAAGTYLFIFHYTFSSASDGMVTFRPVFDDSADNNRRNSNPCFNGLTSSGEIVVIKTFNSASTHKLNISGYGSVSYTSVSGYVDIVRLS